MNENGGIIDDLIVYEYLPDEFLLVVNASKIDEDFAWLSAHPRPASVQLQNDSDRFAALAIQGPRSPEILRAFFAPPISAGANAETLAAGEPDAETDLSGAEALPPKHGGVAEIDRGDVPFVVARTGYTGEEGFELFFPASAAEAVFEELLTVGAPFGLVPCGLGARDTLRLEVCYPLNGSDLSPERTPLEAGLGFFVDLNKEPAFIGRDALRRQKEAGLRERLVAFRTTEKGPPPRPHYPIFKDGRQIGEIASGSQSPSMDCGIGLAYLPAEIAKPGETIEIDIRGRRFPAVIEKKPLYRRTAAATDPAMQAPVG